MKQSEKLDLILKELYNYKHDGKWHDVRNICSSANIPLASDDELMILAQRLKEDGFVDGIVTTDGNGSFGLNSHGIDYCEDDSYTYEGQPVVTNNYNLSIINSPNSNLINSSQNVTISPNLNEVNNAIEKIKEIISLQNFENKELSEDILEYLLEIQQNIENKNNPNFAIKALINMTAGITSIAANISTLAQFAGIV